MSTLPPSPVHPQMATADAAGLALTMADGLPIDSAKMKDGDPVFWQGHRVGTFGGDGSRATRWWIEHLPWNQLPAAFVTQIMARLTDGHGNHETI